MSLHLHLFIFLITSPLNLMLLKSFIVTTNTLNCLVSKEAETLEVTFLIFRCMIVLGLFGSGA